MSRIYVMISKPHDQLMPVLSFATADHTGGGYSVGGLHPSSIAAIAGAGPKVEIKPGERFDVRCNANKKRIAMTLIMNTTKHIPHLEWSSATGLGELPLGLSAMAPAALKKNGGKPPDKGGDAKSGAGSVIGGEGKSKRVRRADRRNSRSTRGSDSGRSNDYEDKYEVEECDEGYITDGEGQWGNYDKNRQIEQNSRRHRDRYEVEDDCSSNDRHSRRSSRQYRDGKLEKDRAYRQLEEKPFVEKTERRRRQRRPSVENPHRNPKYQLSIEDIPERRAKAAYKQDDEGAIGRSGIHQTEEKLNRQRKDGNLTSRYAKEGEIQYQPDEISDYDGYETEYEKPKPRRSSRSQASDDSYDRRYGKRTSRTSSRSRQ